MELQAPLEHHLKDDVQLRAVGLHHVQYGLTGLGPLDAGIAEREHPEADVGQPLGLLAQLELSVELRKPGLDFVARATDALFGGVG